MDLRDWLMVLVSGGGGGLVFWLMGHVPCLADLKADRKRYASLALSVVIPALAWGAMLALGYARAPASWQAALEQLFALAAGALLVGQSAHGAVDLRKKAADRV